MQLKTILNQVTDYKSFRFGRGKFVTDRRGGKAIEVPVYPRKNGRVLCGKCRRPAPKYDRQPVRRWTFVPLWQIAVTFVYAMRRVNCPRCGVHVEHVPWNTGKSPFTTEYRWFLAGWAKRLSWSEVASTFGTSWDTVFRCAQFAVQWGIIQQTLRATGDGIRAIGIDEIAWQKGHKYLTLVYQIDGGTRRLLWVGRERTEDTLRRFFLSFAFELQGLQFVCSDMWKPYLKAIREAVPATVHILDRYHVAAKMNLAIDDVRSNEANRLRRDGYKPLLHRSRWCLLKRPKNLTDKETVRLKELLRYNLSTATAYLFKEDFQRFWEYEQPSLAGKFLREWCARTLRSNIEPMQAIARTLLNHHDLLLNWFKAKGEISAGIVEGFNNKAKLALRKGYGFKSFETMETTLYLHLGQLPEPKHHHRFC